MMLHPFIDMGVIAQRKLRNESSSGFFGSRPKISIHATSMKTEMFRQLFDRNSGDKAQDSIVPVDEGNSAFAGGRYCREAGHRA